MLIISEAPALEAVEYHDIDFINDFNSTSIYRGPPTPEREEAWDKLTYSKICPCDIVGPALMS